MSNINYTLESLITDEVNILSEQKSYVERALHINIPAEEFQLLKNVVKSIGVSENFIDVIDYFDVREGITPAGFEIIYNLKADGLLEIDLLRNISYDENGEKRPTKFIYSADTANPYELEPIKDLIGNLTCNPGIIYDLFINNPEANVGNKFKTSEEVIAEIGRILGPGVDISIEVENPFAPFEEILEEIKVFEEILGIHRLVVKVPHTGSVNQDNVGQLLEGNKKLDRRYNEGSTEDYLRGHNLALKLQKMGYRVNYTLMFEGWQTGMALQARPYFINSFIRQRLGVTKYMNGLLEAFNKTDDDRFLEQLRDFMLEWDFLSDNDKNMDLHSVKRIAQQTIKYRQINEEEGSDGLDGVRHNLRMLKHSNLKDTRLIICSIEGPENLPDLDKLLTEKEFEDVIDRVVITTEPNYLAEFTSAPQITTYQRRFMNAVNKGD